MKKTVLLSFAVMMLTACITPTVSQVELYGEVEDVVYFNGHFKHKVWCPFKEKYYRVIADRLYQPGDTIRIK
jgi:hypothetical protein